MNCAICSAACNGEHPLPQSKVSCPVCFKEKVFPARDRRWRLKNPRMKAFVPPRFSFREKADRLLAKKKHLAHVESLSGLFDFVI